MSNGKDNPTFPEIKKSLVDSIDRIEEYIKQSDKERKEMSEHLKKLNLRMYGSDETDPPVEGMERRIKKLEVVEQERLKNKKEVLKMAIGAFTIAVGGIILWILGALKVAFMKGN